MRITSAVSRRRKQNDERCFIMIYIQKENLYNNNVCFTSSCTHTRPFVLGLKVDSTDLLKVRLTPHTTYNNKKSGKSFVCSVLKGLIKLTHT